MPRIYGYCRISRRTQSIDRQIRNIKAEFEDACIVQEAFTGTTTDRPVWNRLYKQLKAGDTVVFDSVSRMSRNAEEGVAAYEDLMDRGISLVFLKEHYIDTDTYKDAMQGQVGMTGTDVDVILKGVNEYLIRLARQQIVIAFEQSEKEVADLHQRTREGIVTARLNGKQIGGVRGKRLNVKKAAAAKEVILKRSRDFEGTLPDTDVIKLCGVSRNTYYKYKRDLLAAREATEQQL